MYVVASTFVCQQTSRDQVTQSGCPVSCQLRSTELMRVTGKLGKRTYFF